VAVERPPQGSLLHRLPVRSADDEAVRLQRMRRWWLERYSLEELVELGREIGWC
jgi:hypothetical protein